MKITDEMVEAALIKWFKNEISWDNGMAPWSADQFREDMRETLTAALSVAPTQVRELGAPTQHELEVIDMLRIGAIKLVPARETEMIDVDALAQEIRRVDGNHDKGAAALAEALMPFLTARIMSALEGVQVKDSPAPQVYASDETIANIIKEYANLHGQQTEHDDNGRIVDVVCADLLKALSALATEGK